MRATTGLRQVTSLAGTEKRGVGSALVRIGGPWYSPATPWWAFMVTLESWEQVTSVLYRDEHDWLVQDASWASATLGL